MMILNQKQNEIINLDNVATLDILGDYIYREEEEPDERCSSGFRNVRYIGVCYKFKVFQNLAGSEEFEEIAVYYSKQEAREILQRIVDGIRGGSNMFIMPQTVTEPVYDKKEEH